MKGFVQLKNPITGKWVRVSLKTGRIIGVRVKPYRCPEYRGEQP